VIGLQFFLNIIFYEITVENVFAFVKLTILVNFGDRLPLAFGRTYLLGMGSEGTSKY
jgi:hypothetical protein